MYKRVEKHFEEEGTGGAGGNTSSGTVTAGAWKTCEDELVKVTERFWTLMEKCYGGDGAMELGVSDIKAAFKDSNVHSLAFPRSRCHVLNFGVVPVFLSPATLYLYSVWTCPCLLTDVYRIPLSQPVQMIAVSLLWTEGSVNEHTLYCSR
jgi:hypothetical protein